MIWQSAKGRVDIVKSLIEKGVNINEKIMNGFTALHLSQTLEIAKCLVEHGAIIEAVSKNGETPLIYHSKEGRVGVVK